jgi:hypothetical protein
MSIGCHFLPSEQVPTVDQVQQVSARALSRDAADQTVLSRSIVMAGEECERIGCFAHDGQDSLDGDMGEDVVRQQQVLGSPYFLLGSTDAITAQVEGLRALWDLVSVGIPRRRRSLRPCRGPPRRALRAADNAARRAVTRSLGRPPVICL